MSELNYTSCEHREMEIISQIRHNNVFVCPACHALLAEDQESHKVYPITLDRLGELIQVEKNEAKKEAIAKAKIAIANITL